VGGICVGDTRDLPVDDECEILRMPEPHDDRHMKTMVRVASPLIPGVFQPTFHHDCWHNQVRAVLGRVIGPVIKPSFLGIARLKDSALRFASRIPHCPAQSIWDMPARYSGGKRKRYEEAVEKYLKFGISASDAFCNMFVKSDRFDAHEKENPDPRAIQFRSAKYCVALAQFLQPIEHHIYTMTGCSEGVPESRNIAKGLNSVQRAEVLRDKLSHFRSPVVLSLDASRFDKHVSVDLLKIEHSVYTSVNPHFHFRKLLSMQLRNKVYCRTGLKYVASGRRMSGDMNTALGNCLLMLIMVHAFCSHLKLTTWDCFDDGDDCLLIIEEEDLALVQTTLVPHFKDYGMEMKLEHVARSIFEVVFCKSSVVEYADARLKFVRDYRAVISKSLCGIRHWQDPNYRTKVLRAIGICELVLNLGVPILQSFALSLIRNVGKSNDISLASDGLRSRVSRDLRGLGLSLSEVKPRPITDVARVSFATAFNCPIDEQLFYEEFFDNWAFRVEDALHWGDEWFVERWLAFQSTREICPLRQNAESQFEQTHRSTCQVDFAAYA
jgi:hypothetical protein